MSFKIIRQDITKLEVDAIVNAANTQLLMGGGVCGAIFRAAGPENLQDACDKLGPIEVGDAVITPGFSLPAKYVIHTVGPVYVDGQEGEDRLLRRAYWNSLEIAVKNECKSIAFPLISSGIFGYPKDEALDIARKTIQEFIFNHDIDVILVIFDRSDLKINQELLGQVESYIDEHYIDGQRLETRDLLDLERRVLYDQEIYKSPSQIEELVMDLDESFSQMLLTIIDSKGKSDVEVYKKANIDRRLFSKIRSNKDYRPSKKTVLALSIALELSIEETDELLKRAGYALSGAVKFDVIIEFFIVNREYDIFLINEVLFKYDQPLLA